MSAQFPKPGPPGPPGPTATDFVFAVDAPSDSITVTHNLGRTAVQVSCVDASGNLVECGVQIVDADNLLITTVPELPFSGKVLVL